MEKNIFENNGFCAYYEYQEKRGDMNRETVIYDIQSYDGITLKAKIDFPNRGQVDKIVLFCHGSGPNTFDNHRLVNGIEFDYFELFAAEFCRLGVAFCRWNTRGCTPSEEAPYYEVDKAEYKLIIQKPQ